jgi:hypothetical protein
MEGSWRYCPVVDEDYYLQEIRVKGMKHLARGQQFVSDDTVTKKL